MKSKQHFYNFPVFGIADQTILRQGHELQNKRMDGACNAIRDSNA